MIYKTLISPILMVLIFVGIICLLLTIYLETFCSTTDSADDSGLLQFLQPEDVDSGRYDDTKSLQSHICTRSCKQGDSKTCYYRFMIEPWITMDESCGNCTNTSADCLREFCVTADGFERSILAINRKMPGPSIQVCKGDQIVVDVTNMMPGRSTTLHWHGLRQRNFQYMDGVPMVTQCPIPEATTFRYTFTAQDPGLHLYHSHDGLQKVDGVLGSLMIRVPRSEDPNSHLYDFDLPSHVILIQDWHHVSADEIFPGLRNRNLFQMPITYLIQGRGIFRYPNGTKAANTPLATFNVTQGFRYVFRIIAGTCYQCQYVFTIEGHDMVIIGADGSFTEPYRVDSLTMSPGERFSVVVNCNRSVDSYWMKVQTVGSCATVQAFQVGILTYTGHTGKPSSSEPEFNHSFTPGITVNPANSNCTEQERRELGPCAQDLRSAFPPPGRIVATKVNHRILWAFGFFTYPNQTATTNTTHYGKLMRGPKNHVASTVNGVAFQMPPSPLLSQFDDIPKSQFCPEEGFPDPYRWNNELHQCINIMSVPAQSVVEIVMIDSVMLKMSHPIHLHGYQMYVLEQGRLLENSNERVENKTLTNFLNYIDSGGRKEIPKNPVAKDTIPLMSGGYAVVRIFTDNPGFWLFHCHFAYHLDSGMAAVLKVGERTDFPSPPRHFPTCGNYLPTP